MRKLLFRPNNWLTMWGLCMERKAAVCSGPLSPAVSQFSAKQSQIPPSLRRSALSPAEEQDLKIS